MAEIRSAPSASLTSLPQTSWDVRSIQGSSIIGWDGATITPEAIDEIIDRMEDAVGNVAGAQSQIVKLRKAETALLKQFEQARDFILTMLENPVAGRQRLQNIFGGDCRRIARLRACLTETMLSDMYKNDSRKVACESAVESVEKILQELGLGFALRQALASRRSVEEACASRRRKIVSTATPMSSTIIPGASQLQSVVEMPSVPVELPSKAVAPPPPLDTIPRQRPGLSPGAVPRTLADASPQASTSPRTQPTIAKVLSGGISTSSPGGISTSSLGPASFPNGVLLPASFPVTSGGKAISSLGPASFPTGSLGPASFPTGSTKAATFPMSTGSLGPGQFPTITMVPGGFPPSVGPRTISNLSDPSPVSPSTVPANVLNPATSLGPSNPGIAQPVPDPQGQSVSSEPSATTEPAGPPVTDIPGPGAPTEPAPAPQVDEPASPQQDDPARVYSETGLPQIADPASPKDFVPVDPPTGLADVVPSSPDPQLPGTQSGPESGSPGKPANGAPEDPKVGPLTGPARAPASPRSVYPTLTPASVRSLGSPNIATDVLPTPVPSVRRMTTGPRSQYGLQFSPRIGMSGELPPKTPSSSVCIPIPGSRLSASPPPLPSRARSPVYDPLMRSVPSIRPDFPRPGGLPNPLSASMTALPNPLVSPPSAARLSGPPVSSTPALRQTMGSPAIIGSRPSQPTTTGVVPTWNPPAAPPSWSNQPPTASLPSWPIQSPMPTSRPPTTTSPVWPNQPPTSSMPSWPSRPSPVAPSQPPTSTLPRWPSPRTSPSSSFAAPSGTMQPSAATGVNPGAGRSLKPKGHWEERDVVEVRKEKYWVNDGYEVV